MGMTETSTGPSVGGIDFGPVWCASGAMNFFGEGFWYHRWGRPLGLSFRGATFVAKTTTTYARMGNMPLKNGVTPQELVPSCIAINFRQGLVLNAVGLSGPGIKYLMLDGRWQTQTTPFQLSYAPMVGGGIDSRRVSLHDMYLDTKYFVLDMLRLLEMRPFQAPWALQVNLSCPNVEHNTSNPLEETLGILDVLSALKVPLIPKITFLWDPEHVRRIVSHHAVKAITLSNTIPYGTRIPGMQTELAWNQAFGTDIDENGHTCNQARSPLYLKGLPSGGLSGSPLLGPTISYVRLLRSLGIDTHINAGGGVLGPRDALRLLAAGADSISLGSIAFLRPWRVQRTIQAIQRYKQEENNV